MDQYEGVGYFSTDIIIRPTLFLDTILKDWEENEGLGDPSLYIEYGSHFLKDSILEVVGQDEILGDSFSYIVIL